MPNYQIIFEIPSFKVSDFQNFLVNHPKINSFQKINGNNFSIKLKPLSQKEHLVFLKGVKEVFQILDFKENKFCQAKCRDGTNCLNKAQDKGCCWLHNKRTIQKTQKSL